MRKKEIGELVIDRKEKNSVKSINLSIKAKKWRVEERNKGLLCSLPKRMIVESQWCVCMHLCWSVSDEILIREYRLHLPLHPHISYHLYFRHFYFWPKWWLLSPILVSKYRHWSPTIAVIARSGLAISASNTRVEPLYFKSKKWLLISEQW